MSSRQGKSGLIAHAAGICYILGRDNRGRNHYLEKELTMDFETLQLKRESCRVYSDKPVSRETLTHLVEDLLFIEQFQPQMIGIGPFIPHHDTPFGTEPAGSVGMTLKLLSLFRLMHPSA